MQNHHQQPTHHQSATAVGHQQLKHKLSPFASYLEDPDTQELMINGPNLVFVERSGRLERVDIEISEDGIRSILQLIAGFGKKDIVEGTKDSIIDARMPGFRIAGVTKPVAVHGSSISIRKHNPLHLTLQNYVENGQITDEVADIIRRIVRAHKNILIVGGTSSGKTTFLNAMTHELDKSERVLTIEDTQEVKIANENWVALEANAQQGVTIRDLVKLALRFRPDRIIVGEVRGGEAFDLMQAANTGHDGVMATVHASNAAAGLRRMETLVLTSDVQWPMEAVRMSVAETFHYVIFLARRSFNGRVTRGVEKILKIDGLDYKSGEYKTTDIYSNEPDEITIK